MTEPLPGVWVTRDYPVLRELARRFDASHGPFEDHEIAEALQMDTEEVRRAARALSRSGYVKIEEDCDGWLTDGRAELGQSPCQSRTRMAHLRQAAPADPYPWMTQTPYPNERCD